MPSVGPIFWSKRFGANREDSNNISGSVVGCWDKAIPLPPVRYLSTWPNIYLHKISYTEFCNTILHSFVRVYHFGMRASYMRHPTVIDMLKDREIRIGSRCNGVYKSFYIMGALSLHGKFVHQLITMVLTFMRWHIWRFRSLQKIKSIADLWLEMLGHKVTDFVCLNPEHGWNWTGPKSINRNWARPVQWATG